MKVNNKGFTLVELIATLVVLALVMGIGSYSVTTIIQNSKEKEYSLLIDEINNAVEIYYQECRYVNNDCDNTITLQSLLDNGYLNDNFKEEKKEIAADGTTKVIIVPKIVNTKTGKDIGGCKISIDFSNKESKIANIGSLDGVDVNDCPKTEDYNS